jgi:hypothetical protein
MFARLLACLRLSLTSFLLGASLLSLAHAADPTPAEQQYEQLKDAEKHTDQLLGERWNKLIRQRQWVDSSGKHRTYARYLDHDPNLQWVKLLVLVKKGESTYKEGTVPLARLSKNDQALVKRIAIMRKQVEAALADAPAGEFPTGEAPLGEGELPAEMTAAEVEAAAGADGFSPESSMPSPVPAAEPWRTDFAAFAAHFSAAPAEGPPGGLAWGELHALKAVHEKERMLAMLKQLPPEQRPPKAILFQQGFAYGWVRSGLGEVNWMGTLDGSDAATVTTTGLTHDLQLPEPLKLVLLPDPEYAGEASRFDAGQPVQFIGRFEELGGFSDPPQLKLYVRLLADERAATSAR